MRGKVNEEDDGIHPEEARAAEALASENAGVLEESCIKRCAAV